MSATGATLSGSFEGATGQIATSGFLWGESEDALTNDIELGGYASGVTSGTLEYDLTGLSASKTYYYQAYIQEWDSVENKAVAKYGEVKSFTTFAADSSVPSGWLELPAITGTEDYVGKFYGSGSNTGTNRNYSYNYSYDYYGCLWVAYPLTYSHINGSASSGWALNPNIASSKQVNNMFSNSYPSNYQNASDYSKGHQIPNADRTGDATMNAQTYYMTNQTPQLGSSFNSSVWQSLESAIRNLVGSSSSDTVYVATGACYQKVGGNETVNTLTANSSSSVTPKYLPIPNYYWKVLLKVKWDGDEIDSACAIGFWFVHEDSSGEQYTEYAVSVDEIQGYTGFDFFTNLPGSNSSGIEKEAESNTSWTTFKNF